MPDKSSSSWYKTRKAPTASKAFRVLSEFSLQELHDIAVYSAVWFFILFVRLRNTQCCHCTWNFTTHPFDFYSIKLGKDNLFRSPPQQWKMHSLFLYHKWKHLLILNSKYFFSLKVYCVPGRVPFTLERTISAPVSDKSKRKQYLVLNYAKCASGCRCLRKAESREWPDLVSQ